MSCPESGHVPVAYFSISIQNNFQSNILIIENSQIIWDLQSSIKSNI